MMQTEAIFENIGARIRQELDQAHKSIYIAVAWFTNKSLFQKLVEKANGGIEVSLIISNDDINLNNDIDYNRLNIGKSKVFFVGDGGKDLMHNKFCIIDYNTVINGSYNWSYKAETNLENIVITQGDSALAEQFIDEFNNILARYFPRETPKEQPFPLERIIKRLEIIKNFIQLEDMDDITHANRKLSEYDFNADIEAITTAIRQKSYSMAITLIQSFINRHQQITTWNDPEIAALKLEIKVLENQLSSFDNEKIELEKTIANFQHRYSIEVGELVLEILALRKKKFKNERDEEKYKEAEKDEKQYRYHVDTEKEKQVFELTEEKKKELKTKFRKAVLICHPDKVNEVLKEEAERMFIELKNAYESNDLDRVSEILEALEKGNFFRSKSETITDKDQLILSITKLKQKIENIEKQIYLIKENETYIEIQSIDDWDEYFEDLKEKLQNELETLRALVDDSQ